MQMSLLKAFHSNVCRLARVTGIILVACAVCHSAGEMPDSKSAPWRSWRGPYGNGTGVETGLALVDDITKARLVWVSEDPIPGTYASTGGCSYWIGGFSVPLVAEGRVTIAYSCPPGRTNYMFTAEDWKHRTRANRPPRVPDLTADDVVHCFDTKTGKTLWRTVFGGKGLLDQGEGNQNLTGCYADGRLYMPGSAGALYCVDAETGRLIWEAKQEHIKAMPYGSAHIADGIVAFGHKVLHGFDAATGEVLWEGPGGLKNGSAPAVWRHEGKAYFVLGTSLGGLHLIEPRNGRALWKYKEEGMETLQSSVPVAVSGSKVVVQGWCGPGGKKAKLRMGLTCYRISPEGCERVWSCPTPNFWLVPPTIYRGRVYVAARDPEENKKCVVSHDLETGELLARTMGSFLGISPVAVDGRILANVPAGGRIINMLVTDTMRGSVGRPTPDGVDPRGFRIGTCTSFGYAGGFLYARTEEGPSKAKKMSGENTYQSHMICVDLRKE